MLNPGDRPLTTVDSMEDLSRGYISCGYVDGKISISIFDYANHIHSNMILSPGEFAKVFKKLADDLSDFHGEGYIEELIDGGTGCV